MPRAILTVSLPNAEMKKALEERAKRKGHDSVSAYILHAVEIEAMMIDEDEVLRLEEYAVRAYERGETRSGLDHLRQIAR